VEPRAVGRRHLLDEGAVEAPERVRDRLARVREGAVGVRVVRGPHEVVGAEEREQLGAERLLLEGRVDLTAEELAGPRPQPGGRSPRPRPRRAPTRGPSSGTRTG